MHFCSTHRTTLERLLESLTHNVMSELVLMHKIVFQKKKKKLKNKK